MKELVCTFLINEEHGMHILKQLKNWYEHFGGIKELVCTLMNLIHTTAGKRNGMLIFEERRCGMHILEEFKNILEE